MEKNTFNAVKNIINSIYPISDFHLKLISNEITVEEYIKGQVFIELGKHDYKEYFVIDGICRSFLLSPESEETTITFFREGEIVSPHMIRTSDTISLLNFQALTNLKLVSMNANFFHQLMVEYPDFGNFEDQVLRKELIQKVNKEIGLASLSAKDRLLGFRKQYPEFENYIPHRYIASYLGITNVSLSRLRKDSI